MERYPFLKQIIEKYTTDAELPNMGEYCFVFPNRRSSTFFRRYLFERLDEIGKISFLPSFTTISDFIGRFSRGAEASRNEQLFILYDAYRNLLLKRGQIGQLRDFDRFRFWADLILNDFNDVDQYMVDAKLLFKNVKDLKEITADYFTEEQKAVVTRFWGDDFSGKDDVDRFWLHTANVDSCCDEASIRGKFLNLWEILYDLYIDFRKVLRNRKLYYQGMAYRNAAEIIKHTDIADLQYKRYIFVGFNVLSTAELIIFERLRDIGAADFYWDFASPAFFNNVSELQKNLVIRRQMINFHNKATRFVGRNLLNFPPLYPLDTHSVSIPDIEVVAVPSNIGQAKLTYTILEQMVDGGDIKDKDDAIDTCIVVNDESLFVPLMHSLPESIGAINITMGLPVRNTAVAALMTAVISMQLRARSLKGRYHFYYEDVVRVLNHPFMQAIAPSESNDIQSALISGRRYNIDIQWLYDNYPKLRFVFNTVRNVKSSMEVYDYMSILMSTLSSELRILKDNGNPVDGTDRQLAIIDYYNRQLDELRQLTELYAIEMNESSYFHLIEGFVNSSTLNFEGKPLKGLQVMSLLETRALDFDNLIMLSMNERIFPRKHFARTFIPNALRSGYGMSTLDHQESIFSYYFYRLLTRARKVKLLYDSRTSGISSGEMSRYLYQLRYLECFPDINFRSVEYVPSTAAERVISIEKRKSELDRLRKGGDLYLSASALKTFKKCPLLFYLKYIKNLRDEDEVKDYMDEATYGNIVHHVMQHLYEGLRGPADTLTVTERLLDEIPHMRCGRNGENLLSNLLRREINKTYHHLPDDRLDSPLEGDSKIIAAIMLRFIQRMLVCEKALAPFEFYSAEMKERFCWMIEDGIEINFTMSVDRVDYLPDGSIRFIDYKTGADKTDVGDCSKLFSGHDTDAVFQLLLYSEAYCACHGIDADIHPMVYKFKTISTEGLVDCTISTPEHKKFKLSSHRQVHDYFMPQLRHLISRIFDTDEPFYQAKNEDDCKYCKFISMCGRSARIDTQS